MIVTEWDELRDLASSEMRAAMANPLIIDGRNLLDPAETARAPASPTRASAGRRSPATPSRPAGG